MQLYQFYDRKYPIVFSEPLQNPKRICWPTKRGEQRRPMPESVHRLETHERTTEVCEPLIRISRSRKTPDITKDRQRALTANHTGDATTAAGNRWWCRGSSLTTSQVEWTNTRARAFICREALRPLRSLGAWASGLRTKTKTPWAHYTQLQHGSRGPRDLH